MSGATDQAQATDPQSELDARRQREKRVGDLKARAALVGVSAWEADDGTWIAKRCGLWRQLRSDAELVTLIRSLGGRG